MFDGDEPEFEEDEIDLSADLEASLSLYWIPNKFNSPNPRWRIFILIKNCFQTLLDLKSKKNDLWKNPFLKSQLWENHSEVIKKK